MSARRPNPNQKPRRTRQNARRAAATGKELQQPSGRSATSPAGVVRSLARTTTTGVGAGEQSIGVGHSSSPPDDGSFRPLPVHFRLLYAIESSFQDGLVVSDAVIAKRMGGKTSRETICRWRRRNPRLMAWIREQLAGTVLERKPFVDRRVTHLAEQGSVEHTKLYYAYVEKLGALPDDGAGAPGSGVTINVLVPHPHLPNGGTLPAPARTAAPATVTTIPMVTVR